MDLLQRLLIPDATQAVSLGQLAVEVAAKEDLDDGCGSRHIGGLTLLARKARVMNGS